MSLIKEGGGIQILLDFVAFSILVISGVGLTILLIWLLVTLGLFIVLAVTVVAAIGWAIWWVEEH